MPETPRTELRLGDVVLIRTGQMNLWPDIGFVRDTPGLNREGAEYLAKHGAIMIGADNLTLEQTPTAPGLNFFPVHTYLLAEAGVPLLEMAQLDELAGRQALRVRFFRRLHQAARRHRRAYAAGGDAAAMSPIGSHRGA